jgi:hypothetical protein
MENETVGAVDRSATRRESTPYMVMHAEDFQMIKFLLWLILLVICWPLALLALILYPIVWLILLPFRLIGITVDAFFHLIRAIFMFPARVLRG